MSALRIMEIPANRTGLGEGTWLRWTELRLWLVERDERGTADDIEEVLVKGESVSTREVTVRR
jgi:hypothetical protein